MKKILFFLSVILLTNSTYAQQENNGAYEPYFKYNWVLNGCLSVDFFPFGFNNRKFYSTEWAFNYTTGFQLKSRIKKKNLFFGAGILYSQKDHTQDFNCSSCKVDASTELARTSSLRYIEIPISFDFIVISNRSTNVLTDVGIISAFAHKAFTVITREGGQIDTSRTNFEYYNRFIFGAQIGFEFNYSIADQYSIGINPHFKFYYNDLFDEFFLNLSSMGFMVKLNYHLD